MSRRLARLLAASLWVAGGLHLLSSVARAQGPTAEPTRGDSPIVLAYYYIRYRDESWDAQGRHTPMLGPYSSDDLQVMERHAGWAKAAGIDGFIVSWKSTDSLNARLANLVRACRGAELRLGIIYQGLDYERNPRPIERVAGDLSYLAARFGNNPVFAIFGRPMVIWNGIWEYSYSEVEQVTQDLRDRLLILASARNDEGYLRVADLVDGNAYYWSSVNPDTYGDYPGKLLSMAEVVRGRGGLWVAPAAPGYDARLIGGEQVVDRQQGQTLRRQMDAAVQSSPDVIGLISWNEFSERTYLEPSEVYGTQYLQVLADTLGSTTGGGPALDLSVQPFEVFIRTVPAIPGVRFTMGGQTALTAEDGVARMELEQVGTYRLETDLLTAEESGGSRGFARWRASVFAPELNVRVPRQTPVEAGFDRYRHVDLRFVDAAGRVVEPERIESVTLISSDGFRETLDRYLDRQVRSNRIARRLDGLEAVSVTYRIDSVIVDGSNVVNQGQQRFDPAHGSVWQVELLLYSVQFAARDALLKSPMDGRLHLQLPDGNSRVWSLESGEVSVSALARGLYRATVEGAAGVALPAPFVLSRDRQVTLLVLSYLDLLGVALVGAGLILLPLLAGRPRLRQGLRRGVARWLR